MRIRTAFAAVVCFVGLASVSLGQQVVATGRDIRDPQMAVAGTGDYMIVWWGLDNPVTSPQSYGVFARVFEASGRPKGSVFLVHGDRAGTQILPQVAADAQGNFVVVWQGGFFSVANDDQPGGDGDGAGIFAQRFNRNGTKIGPSFRLSRSAAEDQLTPNVAMAADGSFVAAWQHCTPRCSELHVGRYTAGGEPRGEEIEIPVLTATGRISGDPIPNPTPFVAIEPAGFAVGLTEQEVCCEDYFEQHPVIVHFADSGLEVGRFRLDDAGPERRGWSLAALTTNGTGSSAAFLNGERSSVQLFEPDGVPAGSRKVIGKKNPCRGDRCEYIGDAAMEAGGGFVVAWNTRIGQVIPNRHPLQVQFFDSVGASLGKRIEVASSRREIFPPALAFMADGGLLVIWAEPEADGLSHRLFSRKIRRN